MRDTPSLSAAVAILALGMAADPYVVQPREQPVRRRRPAPATARDTAPHEAEFRDDGFDAERLDAAARKRARKAAKLSVQNPAREGKQSASEPPQKDSGQ